MTVLLLALLAFPAVLFLLGMGGRFIASDSSVTGKLSGDSKSGVLYVLVHGMAPKESRWESLSNALAPHGRILRLSYNAARWSNAKPHRIAQGIASTVAEAEKEMQPKRIVFVAHSMGALLARRAILDARSTPWVGKVGRVLLLAGVNRGWDLAGDAPSDQDPLYRLWMRLGYWGADMLHMSGLVFSFERGSPFVANLRLDWMRWIRSDEAPPIEVVQMVGDIDDVIRREDNEDLRVIASQQFVQLLVRGTGHGDIIEFGASATPRNEEAALGSYRREKVVLAATADFPLLRPLNEAQPYATDDTITELVFVLHGIRDLGRWAANFESAIERRYPGRRAHLAIVSSRYGYFGMGPFLFEGVRKRYVRWFMDQYTETLARYPKLDSKGIRFFGHSNGTYIVTEALRTYDAMAIDRLVLAGSVVRRDFDWASLMQPGSARVRQVRNYVGTEDWVVALFPRLFELPVMSWLRNSIGSAGFNGFNDEQQVDNVRYVQGEHSAFENRVDEIVEYLLADGPPAAATLEKRSWVGVALGLWPIVLVTWLAIVLLVVGLGTRVVAASAQPVWPVLLAYLLVVWMILRTV